MSAPPPGGSPPPQQPYPPQYPPQQPYYAPQAAPPPKKSNTALIIVLVVVIVVVVLAVIAWWAVTALFAPVNQATQYTITGVSWTVNYPGSVHYFGTSPLTTCTAGFCPHSGTVLQQFTYTLTLSNSDSSPHNVTDVSLAGYTFTIISTSPTISTSSPLVVPAGGSGSVILTIQPSSFGGTYTLTGTITTT